MSRPRLQSPTPKQAQKQKHNDRHRATAKGHATNRAWVSNNYQANREHALLLMGDRCANPKCRCYLRKSAWGAHHKTPRAITGRKFEWYWGWERIEAELLNDMELLCVPCHRMVNHRGLIYDSKEDIFAFKNKTKKENTDGEDSGHELVVQGN